MKSTLNRCGDAPQLPVSVHFGTSTAQMGDCQGEALQLRKTFTRRAKLCEVPETLLLIMGFARLSIIFLKNG